MLLSKHSPEHHPSSALIDAGQCFTRAAKKLAWSAAATNPETYSGIVPARHPAPRLFESGEETVTAKLGNQQLHSLSLLAFTLALRQAQSPPLECSCS